MDSEITTSTATRRKRHIAKNHQQDRVHHYRPSCGCWMKDAPSSYRCRYWNTWSPICVTVWKAKEDVKYCWRKYMLGSGFENLKPYPPFRSSCLFSLMLNLWCLSCLLLASCLLLDGVLSLWKHKPKSHCSWSGFFIKATEKVRY